MTNRSEEPFQTKQTEGAPTYSGVPLLCGVPLFSAELQSTLDSSVPETNTRASGTEVWRAVLKACQQIPKPLQHAFVVQVLVSILDDQAIPIRGLQEALRKGFESVQRVEEARRCRCDL